MMMDKEQYFQAIHNNQGAVIYEMYKEKFDETRHEPFLDPVSYTHLTLPTILLV